MYGYSIESYSLTSLDLSGFQEYLEILREKFQEVVQDNPCKHQQGQGDSYCPGFF